MKTLLTASVLAMLLTAATAFAADQSTAAGVPPKGIEGPDVRHSQMEARPNVEWPVVR